jgi:hypothetical protein
MRCRKLFFYIVGEEYITTVRGDELSMRSTCLVAASLVVLASCAASESRDPIHGHIKRHHRIGMTHMPRNKHEDTKVKAMVGGCEEADRDTLGLRLVTCTRWLGA